MTQFTFSRKLLFAALLILIALLPLLSHQKSASAKELATSCEKNRVIVVMVDELRWSDITPQSTPFINSLAEESYVASLTTGRTEQSRSVISSFSTFSAGSRTFDDGTPFSLQQKGEGSYTIGIGDLVKKNKDSLFEASIGTLQESLTKNGAGSALIDSGLTPNKSLANASMVAISDSKGNVSNAFASDNPTISQLLDNSSSSALFVHIPLQDLSTVDSQARAIVDKYQTEKSSVFLVGVNTFEKKRSLLVAALSVDGKQGLLASATRQREGLIEQTDIGPTILNQLCLSPENNMEGSPATLHNTGSFTHNRDQFITDNRDARQREFYNADSVTTLLILAIVLAGLLIAERLVPSVAEKLRWSQKIVALVAVNFFTATFIVNIFNSRNVNDWRMQTIAITIALLVVVFVLERTINSGFLASVGIFTSLLFADVFLNNIFQSNSAFGYSFINNSRSYGFSNIGSAAFSFGVIFIMFHFRNKFTKTAGKIMCGIIFIGALGIIGHPRFGADVGGALSSAPAFAIAFLYFAKFQIRARWIFLTGIFSVLAISLFAYLDYLRPETKRSHLGRLVNDVKVDGITPLAHTLERKFGGMLSTFTSLWFIVAIICGVSLVILHRSKAFRKEIFVPILVLAFFGTFLNDAGFLVGGSIMLLSLCAAMSAPEVRLASIPILERTARSTIP